MSASEAATYERARRRANIALWTINLQVRRLKRDEPEDKDFVLRKFADFHFLIIALDMLYKAGTLASKVASIEPEITKALAQLDSELPYLRTVRNVDQHFDEYALDEGYDTRISRKSLEVYTVVDDKTWRWLEFEVDIEKALKVSERLFQVIQECQTLLGKQK